MGAEKGRLNKTVMLCHNCHWNFIENINDAKGYEIWKWGQFQWKHHFAQASLGEAPLHPKQTHFHEWQKFQNLLVFEF